MTLAISALGFAIYTLRKVDTWEGLKQLEKASEFAELYVKGLRPFLAEKTFIQALERRDRLYQRTRKR